MRQAQAKREKSPGNRDSTGVVTVVAQEEFLSFISGGPYSIIWAGNGASPEELPFAIVLRLGLFHIPPVRIGVVDLSTIEWTALLKLYVRMTLGQLQMESDPSGAPPAGYYLFARGKLIAFHPGSVDFNEDGTALGWGIAVGLFGLLAKSREITHIGHHVATWKAGDRVAEVFSKAVQEDFSACFESGASEADVGQWESDALHQAYTTLELSPSASVEEVVAKHKLLVRECHPDRFANEPTKYKWATERTAELNAARDFILNHHGRRR
jgi:hypothetical protein